MTVDDERAARTMLADLTAGQPAAPPDRLGAVRRRAVLRRRRQFAAIAAVIAVVAVAAATIPLRLIGSAPPVAPASYHLSEQPPGPGARAGLVATGVVDGTRWGVSLSLESGHPTGSQGTGLCLHYLPGSGTVCGQGVQPAFRTGTPVDATLGGQSGAFDVSLGTVRGDVTSVQVRYTNGQLLTLHPVVIFGSGSARYVVIVTPSPGSVMSVTAFAGHRDLGYAVPFSGKAAASLIRWLRPGQPALPRPVTRVIGSGSAGGSSWNVKVAIGPWGTCVYASSGLGVCRASTDPRLPAATVVSPHGGIAILGYDVQIYSGQAAPQVSYLTITTKDGTTSRVPVVSVGALRFYACADVQGNRIVRWAAYDAAAHLLASSKPGQIP